MPETRKQIIPIQSFYCNPVNSPLMCVLNSKVSRPDKLAVHVFEVDEDVDKDEVSRSGWNRATCVHHCQTKYLLG